MKSNEEKLVEELKRAYTFDEEFGRYGILGMRYDKRVIDFFKRHNLYDEEMFKHLQANTWGICYADPDKRRRIGCPYITGNSKKILGYVIIIPDKTNDHTMFSQVHEIAHGIYAYKHLGKSVQSEYYEVLPLLVEKLYVEESNNEEVKSYSKYLDSMIDESDNISYKFALYARNQLLEGFNGNIDDLDNQCDLLLDSYENEHKL